MIKYKTHGNEKIIGFQTKVHILRKIHNLSAM